MNRKGGEGLVYFVVIVLAILAIGFLFWAFPQYGVYSKTLSGKAELKEAEWNRQIAIEEAGAELEASELKKQTDIVRAEGIAEANAIISMSLTDKYIRWKWVEGLHDGSSEVIYVPTEANLPILEARDVRIP